MDENKIIIFHLIPVQGHSGWNLSELLRAQGGTHLELTPFHLRKTHTRPHSLSLGQCRHTIHLTCTLLGCGKKPESPEKIPRHGESAQTPYRQWPWQGIHFFPHQRYNERTLKERTIFKDCTRHFFNDDTSSLTQLAFLSPDSFLCLSSNESITTLG